MSVYKLRRFLQMYIYTVMGNDYENNTEIYVGIDRDLILDINKVITRWIERENYDEDVDNPDEFKSYSLRVWEDGYLIKRYTMYTELGEYVWVETYDTNEGYIDGGRITEII
ncbi:hypothetical protein D1872_36980 [compost metagenome]